MITVEYQPNVNEMTKATLDFLECRPLIKTMTLLMKICCFIMGVAYILKATANILNLHDMLVILFVLTWLFGQRSINNFILKRNLTRKKIHQTTNKFYLHQHKILWQTTTDNKQTEQRWKQIKYIYQNKDGYIIPAIGAKNAGKFIWLPKRGFNNLRAENDFLDLLKQLGIIIKNK
jgi:hypothetical protein